jgi:histidyl-tRNA synthetase
MDESAKKIAFKSTIALRQLAKVTLEYDAKSLKAHLKQADKHDALWCACIGQNELEENSVWLKNLATKKELKLPLQTFEEGTWLITD